jgi:DNA repair protein RadC
MGSGAVRQKASPMSACSSPSIASLPVAPVPPAGAVGEALPQAGLHRQTPARRRVLDHADRFGAETLGDAEILMVVFSAADQRKGLALADQLIARFGGLAAVLAADRSELGRHVSAETCLAFKVLREAAGRVGLAALAERQPLTAFHAVAAFFTARLRGLPHEEVWAAFLDRKNQLIVAEPLSRGTVDHAPVYVREVMKRALDCGAAALVLAHNHPSGDPTPSHQDLVLTRAIAEAGKLLGIVLHDHLVIGGQGVASFKVLGLL